MGTLQGDSQVLSCNKTVCKLAVYTVFKSIKLYPLLCVDGGGGGRSLPQSGGKVTAICRYGLYCHLALVA